MFAEGCWEAEVGDMAIRVYFMRTPERAGWWLECEEIGADYQLDATDAEAAKAEAIAVVRQHLVSSLTALDLATREGVPPHPMQPVVITPSGVARFRPNRLVVWMLEQGATGRAFDMNTMYAAFGGNEGPHAEELEQFAQLIGYSVSGFGGLSYASKATTAAADEAVAALLATKSEGPDPS